MKNIIHRSIKINVVGDVLFNEGKILSGKMRDVIEIPRE